VAFPFTLSSKAQADIAAKPYEAQQAAHAFIAKIAADPLGMTDRYHHGARLSEGMQLAAGGACYVQVHYSFIPKRGIVRIIRVPLVISGGLN
jgi:hypothetical protein